MDCFYEPLKTTYYNDICVNYYPSLKYLSTIYKGNFYSHQYIDYTTKHALKLFREYIKNEHNGK